MFGIIVLFTKFVKSCIKKLFSFALYDKAFSIIELAVAIITTSLILVVVLVGTNMIFAAKVQHVISQLMEYEKAVNVFYSTYNYLPGDFRDTYIWSDKNIKENCYYNNSGSLDNSKLNASFIAGNGDMLVHDSEIDVVNCHFALSGIISVHRLGRNIFANDYQGMATSADAKYASGLWIDEHNLLNLGNLATDPFSSGGSKFNSIVITSHDKSNYYSARKRINTTLSTKLLKAVDVIMDDGKPGTGNIRFIGIDIKENKICMTTGGATLSCMVTSHTNYQDNERGPTNEICSSVSNFVCDVNSEFINISSKQKNSTVLYYLPDWLRRFTNS
ncbi:hypothetical protein CAXC1_70023 [Candidatus Xenohaliotis californiensis]|uniref:Prepilin-type N-terminal cleavage/methylation domain-containing protein n=1 Tax=Candidatus Xenohaliotis californiensis TaxID=84677 RepID=A0ABP0EWA2_9RICK|nr:hypothetical protein CAXC1_70023 [Candidatus Xenohaliotis californiensis]